MAIKKTGSLFCHHFVVLNVVAVDVDISKRQKEKEMGDCHNRFYTLLVVITKCRSKDTLLWLV